MTLRYISLFSGIGSPEKALTDLGIDFELIAYSEIDKYASKSYAAIHGVSEELNLGDITKIDTSKLPTDIDLITHGSPCVDFSIAGKQAGGDENSGTRSSLMYETLRIVEAVRPKFVLWENVKNVLSKKHIHNFDAYRAKLKDLGYNSYYKVLDAQDYGIPQHRERIFVVSIREDIDTGKFEFPKPFELKLRLKDMLEETVDEKYYLKNTKDFFIKNSFDMENKGNGFRFDPHVKKNADIAKTITTRAGARMDDNFIIDIDSENKTFKFDSTNDELNKVIRLGGVFDTETSKHQAGSVYDTNGLAPTLDTMQGGWRQPCIIEKDEKIIVGSTQKHAAISKNGICPTLTSAMGMGGGHVPMHNYDTRIRKLTPKECWRLMGFDDSDIDKCISTGLSNTQLYKQAGNSIVVNVLVEIYKELFKAINLK